MSNNDSIFKKLFNFPKTSTNIDTLIGKVALVIKDIDNLRCVGEVCINNDYWSAINIVEDEIIKKCTKVKILEIRGVKVVVEKL